jgi:glyoxylase-like metal-dependent hydrolase (beta-lactamase superfamily II)
MDEQVLAPGKNNATAMHQNRPAQWVMAPTTAYLVEFPGGYALFDTGLHEDTLKTHAPELGFDGVSTFVASKEMFFPERLLHLGLKPDGITHVVQSHLHTDHAGYLHLFTDSEIIVNEDEFTSGLKYWALKANVGPYNRSDFSRFLDADLRFNLLGNEVKQYKIADGVTVLNFGPGHSFGNLGLFVELAGSGNFLLVSDALYNDYVIDRLPGFVYDSIGYLKTAKFITQYAKEHDAQIVYGHNRGQFTGLVKSTEGFYE